MIRFTEEEKLWLKDNYPNDESQKETYRRFCEKFGNIHSFKSVITFCKKNKIQKPLYRQKYQKGNVTWSTGLTKEEHKTHFTKESYEKICTHVYNFPNLRNRIKYNVPKGYVLSYLGNGEYLIMEKSIHKCMQYQNALHQGELTKAMYETYLVKREIEKIKGKRIMRNCPQNSSEFLAKIRNPEARKKAIIAIRNGVEQEFASLTEASNILNISPGCISRVLNGQRTHTHHYVFKSKGE